MAGPLVPLALGAPKDHARFLLFQGMTGNTTCEGIVGEQ
jgi:hypothetical protein